MEQPKVFSIRIVAIDYYMASPMPAVDVSHRNFLGGNVKEVPVIRIFGSTPAGQKTCLHVHGALPYLYIPLSDLGNVSDAEVNSRVHAMSLDLDKALRLRGNAGLKRQHIHSWNLVRAKKFYGYHFSEELFLKIYFYYPQDVSRAANILLTGAIMNRVLQPYESHIPFLLQFLIDYNLYGMGHLHVSRIRFRLPVPDAFTERKIGGNGKPNLLNDYSTMDSDSQAALSDGKFSNLPVWISATIPDGQILQHSSGLDPSVTEDMLVFKRQSTSELEGDVVVDEIMNKQFISHVPLSQTDSEAKVVQSLIPIWEEELERIGVPEAIPPDSNRPLPQDLLRILSDRIDLEKFMQVANDEESGPHPTPKSTTYLMDSTNLVESKHVSSHSCKNITSKYLKESENNGEFRSLDFISHAVDESKASVVDISDQLQLFNSTGQSSEKVSDEDALRLLKWLASSQAAEDINSDDELIHATILSPLIPAKDVEKMLEQANVDQENESQQECQDILDSIDMLNFEELNGKIFDAINNRNDSPDKIIPQLDGSYDDEQSTPCFGSALEPNANYTNTSMEVQSPPRLDSIVKDKHENKKPRWCSLPISCQNVSDEKDLSQTEQSGCTMEFSTRDLMRRKRSHLTARTVSRSMVEDWKIGTCCTDDRKRDVTLGTGTRFEAHDYLLLPIDKSQVNTEKTKFYQKETNYTSNVSNKSIDVKPIEHGLTFGNLPLCSSTGVVPEIMQHIGNQGSIVQHNSSKNSDVNLEANYCTYEQPCHSKHDSSLQHFGSTNFLQSCVSSHELCNLNEDELLSEDESPSKNYVPYSRHTVLGNPGEDSENIDSKSSLQQCKDSLYHGSYSDFSAPYYSTLDLLNKKVELEKPVTMVFSKKPPKIEWTDELDGDAPGVALDGDRNGRTFLQGRLVKDFPPFFTRNFLFEKVGRSSQNDNCLGHCESTIGVPFLYQNDGSHLFTLTPMRSPPSRESIERWLMFDCSDTQLVPPITSKRSCCDLNDPRGSQDDASKSPGQVSASLSNYKSHCDRPHQNNQASCSKEIESHKVLQKNLVTGDIQDISQLSGPDRKMKSTPLSQIGFRDPASVGEGQQLTLLSVEVQAESRGDLRPDPRFDAINVLVLVLQEDNDSGVNVHVLLRCDNASAKNLDALSDCRVLAFTEELQLFSYFTKLIHFTDPDVIMGWDVQSGSLGFLAERARHLGLVLLNEMSRTRTETNVISKEYETSGKTMGDQLFSKSMAVEAVHLENIVIEDEWGRTQASGVHVGGRIVLNIWRLMRNEIKLNMYTVEAVAEAVLRRKVPCIHWKVLTKWFSSGPGRARHRSIDYVLKRAKINLEILNQLDFINRTSELARVFGIDFFSVLSRGSQYRVESMFLRLAHTQNYLAISPGNHQVANQPAMECLPLVMEPESSFFADPVVVLDFQSLYPSMVIAYNLCYCTCLGKISSSIENCLGVSSYSPDINILDSLKDDLLVTPNGVVYVPSKVRRGILPRLLEEILSTRIMVKQSMKKLDRSQQILHRIFDARQLALKLIANVTYGYTAAGFSGRMPCAELADSIVQCGRRTLETAISFVNANDRWKARVVYGDTDSMFVLLKDRSLKEAFVVGQEIASAITEMNPNPIKLKMEKVYYPCFLLTKKRYVGYSYESHDQCQPKFDAKGIETVRRDTCEAVSKTMEQSLRIYFECQNIDKVKAYIQRQWTRILSGRVSLQDFVFAKEVRLGTYSTSASSLPPAAIVATKAMRVDPRAEPRYAERIPYIVVHGEPGARLVDMVVDPFEVLALNSPFRLNDMYYIRKQIMPALQRVFGLVGADLNQWFLEIPRPSREAAGKRHSLFPNLQQKRIEYYYTSKHCIVCGDLVQPSTHLCFNCHNNVTSVAIILTGRASKLEKDIQHLAAVCRHCGGGDWCTESGVKCISLACPIFFERSKVQKQLLAISEVSTRTGFYPKCMVEWF